LLGLSNSCSRVELRLAYRRRAMQWHPDRHQTSAEDLAHAEQMMREINLAYDLLLTLVIEPSNSDVHANSTADETPAGTDAVSTSEFCAEDATAFTEQEQDSIHSVGAADFWSAQKQPPRKKTPVVRTSLWVAAVFLVACVYFYQQFADSLLTPVTVKVDTAAVRSSKIKNYLKVGMTPGEVIAIQGVPTQSVGMVWFYHDSQVHFDEQGLAKWYSSPNHPLKVKPGADTLEESLATHSRK